MRGVRAEGSSLTMLPLRQADWCFLWTWVCTLNPALPGRPLGLLRSSCHPETPAALPSLYTATRTSVAEMWLQGDPEAKLHLTLTKGGYGWVIHLFGVSPFVSSTHREYASKSCMKCPWHMAGAFETVDELLGEFIQTPSATPSWFKFQEHKERKLYSKS